MLSLLIALASVQTAPQSIPPAKAGRLVPLLTGDDYPAEAVRKNWQGSVVTELKITKKGRVRACKVIESSGHAVLDKRTCEILIERARFNPAKDSAGRTVEGTYRMPPIKWGQGN